MSDFINRANYDDVYLRSIIVGFLGFLKDKFNYVTKSEENGNKKINVPVYYSFTGENRYIMDAFYDDVPDKRVNSNTDQIPRATIKLNSWNVKNEEFNNPNVWVDTTKELGEDILEFATQVKAVPLKLNFELEIVLDNEIDIFKVWESYMRTIWIYKYFKFSYHRIPISGVFNFIGDTDNTFARDYSFGDVEKIKTTYQFEVHTFFPLFDINRNEITNYNNDSNYAIGSLIYFNNQTYEATTNISAGGLNPDNSDSFWQEIDIDQNVAMFANKRVDFILNMWQNNNNPTNQIS